ncbi:cytochrome P450 [Cryptosporangium japonicum]|uniref:Cytochrome P450 n=1 Tax=Cryptosporangium japonicum TaxID=80872 RepID=A0ABN0TK43_9ACTN
MTQTVTHSVPDDLERRPDPYPWLEELRAAGPVRRLRIRGDFDAWIVTRYDDVRRALTDPRLSSDQRHAADVYAANPLFRRKTDKPTSMLLAEAPDHGRLRGAVSRAFTARRVELLRPRIQEIADGLIDAFAARGTADLVGEYAFPLPIEVICELLGVPADDHDRFRDLSAKVVTPARDPAGMGAIVLAFEQLKAYVRELVARKYVERGNDLLSELVEAGEAGVLSDEEIAASGVLLLVGGHETTANLIGTSIRLLLRHPEHLAAVRADPAVLPRAIEEYMRIDGPNVLGVYRHTTEDVTIGGVTIPRGQIVVLSISAANHDPDRFERPGLVDLDRPDNAHLSFGHGMHYCLGAPLARLEGDLAIATILRRLPDLRLVVAPDELVWRPAVLRGLESLPIQFSATTD